MVVIKYFYNFSSHTKFDKVFLSVTKKAFLKPRLAASTAMTLRHPAPK